VNSSISSHLLDNSHGNHDHLLKNKNDVVNYLSSSSRNWNARCVGLSHHTNNKFLQNHGFFLRMSLLCWLGHPKNNGWVNSYKGIKVRLKALGPNEKNKQQLIHMMIQTICTYKPSKSWNYGKVENKSKVLIMHQTLMDFNELCFFTPS